jgi:two-component system sensor histidine kinase MprB
VTRRPRLRLRGRLTVLAAGIVGVVLVLGSLFAYLAVRDALIGQIDQQLRGQAAFSARFAAIGPPPGPDLKPPRRLDLPVRPGKPDSVDLAQTLSADGHVLRLLRGAQGLRIPVSRRDKAVAAGDGGLYLSDRTVAGNRVRVIALPLPTGGAVVFGRSLEGVDNALDDLRIVLALLVLGGTLAAALLARLFSRSVIRPVTALTEAAEHIEATGDLGRRVDAGSDDEVGRMAGSFNGMLDRVQDSVAAQRQLVADASHELRTPVSALRTNVEVLEEAGDALDVGQRRAILEDVVAQADELGDLVGDLIELARGEEPHGGGGEFEDVRFDALVAEAVERARRHAPTVPFTAELAPCVLNGAPDRLARAVNNLLDNAAKYGGSGGPVEVTLSAGDPAVLSVRDHGQGVDPAEVDHIFDRFARGALARERAGSGLGLAIVRQVAHAHGGTASVEPPAGGGARFVLRLPGASAPES